MQGKETFLPTMALLTAVVYKPVFLISIVLSRKIRSETASLSRLKVIMNEPEDACQHVIVRDVMQQINVWLSSQCRCLVLN